MLHSFAWCSKLWTALLAGLLSTGLMLFFYEQSPEPTALLRPERFCVLPVTAAWDLSLASESYS